MARNQLRLGSSIRPNVGIGESYRKELEALIEEMNNSLLYWLTARWKSNPPATLAMDEAPSTMLIRTMWELGKRWTSRFEEVAPKIAAKFVKGASKWSDGTLEKVLDEAGMLVNFKVSRGVRDTLNATTAENVGLIKSIAAEHLADVQGLVMRSVTQGRDLHVLAKGIEDRYGKTKDRAALIARHQNNMATATIVKVRQQEAGITHAVWMHSHAGRVPRPEHLAFSQGKLGGPVYDVEKGAFLEGKWTWPGCEINCRCYSKPVIPGF